MISRDNESEAKIDEVLKSNVSISENGQQKTKKYWKTLVEDPDKVYNEFENLITKRFRNDIQKLMLGRTDNWWTILMRLVKKFPLYLAEVPYLVWKQDYKSTDSYEESLERVYKFMKVILTKYGIPFEDTPESYVDLLSLHFPKEKVS